MPQFQGGKQINAPVEEAHTLDHAFELIAELRGRVEALEAEKKSDAPAPAGKS